MKKIFTSLLIMLMLIVSQVLPTAALSYDESYTSAKGYYSQKTSFNSFSELYAYEAIGLDSSDYSIDHLISTDYASEIAQSVIALSLHGDNPKNYNGVNYVEMLENCVQSNGAFDKKNNSTYANFQVYGVFALYVVDSPKLSLAADYLTSLIDDNGAFGSSYGPSLDITSWVIESLSLVDKDKYQPTIQRAIVYLQSMRDGQAGYKDSFSGVNVNTQASVMTGLLTYDAKGVKAGTYNQNGYNPYDVLLKYQNTDGSFWYSTPGEVNDYATVQGIQTIGYYYNESVYQKAKQDYLALDEIIDTEKQPEIEVKPEVEVEQEVEKTETSSSQSQKQPQKEVVTETTKQKDVVQTDDQSWLFEYGLLFMGSGILLLKGRKYFE